MFSVEKCFIFTADSIFTEQSCSAFANGQQSAAKSTLEAREDASALGSCTSPSQDVQKIAEQRSASGTSKVAAFFVRSREIQVECVKNIYYL